MAKKGQNLVNGIDGVNGLPAIDFNAATREVQDAFIECQPSIPDPSGTAQYGANNEIKQYLDLQTISRASAFICSGSGNAYVLTTDTAVHLRQFTFIQKYSKIHFIASFTNTGSCTVNVDFFGIKSIKLANGSDPLADYITANNRYTIYYNGTHWVLTNPTISTKYLCNIYKQNGVDQSITKDILTKVLFPVGSTIDINDNNFFNTSNSRFQPTVAGWYRIDASIEFKQNGGTTTWGCQVLLYRNNSTIRGYTTNYNFQNIVNNVTINDILYFNGTTDYVEIYGLVYGAATSFVILGNRSTYFMAEFLKT